MFSRVHRLPKNVILSFLFVGSVVLIIEIHSVLRTTNTQSDPITIPSMYHLLQKPLNYFSIERPVYLLGYFGVDKRLYVGWDDAKIFNVNASVPVQYQEFMSGCLGSYVNVYGSIKIYEGQYEPMVYDFKIFSKVLEGEISDYATTQEDMIKVVSYSSASFNCNLAFPLGEIKSETGQ
jgi:hypothetical protein